MRVEEVYALDKLSEISKTEIFATALGKAAAQKWQAIANVLEDPGRDGEGRAGRGRAFREGPRLGRRWSRPTS